MLRWLAICFFGAALLPAEVTSPRIGFAHYQDGSLRPVLGVAGAFVVGEPISTGVNAAAVSGTGGLIAKHSKLLVLDSNGSKVCEYPIGDAHPVLGIRDGISSAIAWLPQSHQVLFRSKGVCLTAIELTELPGQVTSLRQNGDRASLLVTSGDAVFEVIASLSSGQVLSVQVVPGVQGPTYGYQSLYITLKGGQISVCSAHAPIKTFKVPDGDLQLEWAGSGWAHIWSATGQQWALNLTGPEPTLFELPNGGAQ
jgi:hypothetical protein